ncbi:hypothetical protein SAMN04487996_11093 [Dyadobacter soli]|uniref:Uncharacterized protein n=1 Tax=Dyadobacter soli TaxID=659014 RepID=A0A1G7KEB8_9BACT|nr:hypothetical protein SAMN04487996_11093 [Dyadobacter soli]
MSGYFVPDIGNGTPGIIPLDAAEPLTDAPAPEEAYYGKCVLTSVSNFWQNPAENTAPSPTGMVEPEKVRVIHYPDCQQLVFHMPQYAWDAGTFRLTNACSEEIIEEKPVRQRLNGGTMILTNTLPYPPGCYTIEADWPDGWTHRIQFIKFTEGFPKFPFENAPANFRRAIRNEEVHLLYEPEPEIREGYTADGRPIPDTSFRRDDDWDYTSPACSLHIARDSDDDRFLDYTGIEKLKKQLMSRFIPKLEYTQDGRGGSIYYKEGEISIQFGWEFGGGNTVVIIFIPETKYWEAQTGTPLSRRDEILDFLCQQVIRDQARGCHPVMYDDAISIVR